jgi:hypothetical protein
MRPRFVAPGASDGLGLEAGGRMKIYWKLARQIAEGT